MWNRAKRIIRYVNRFKDYLKFIRSYIEFVYEGKIESKYVHDSHTVRCDDYMITEHFLCGKCGKCASRIFSHSIKNLQFAFERRNCM